MRILLLSYAVIPSFSKAFGNEKFTNGAGWIVGIHNALEASGNEVAIVSPYNAPNDKKVVSDKTTYYAIPRDSKDVAEFNTSQIAIFKEILDDFKPDAVTVFGTEFAQGYAMLLACKDMGLLDKTVIFTQGLISMIERYYVADVPEKVVHHKSLREFFSRMDIGSQRKLYIKRGDNERKMLGLAKHIIGGTVWDRTVIKMINPDISYHYCPEILRNGFYENRWDINTCEKHSIFAVPSDFYPLKGFHYLLEGMSVVVKKYPDAKLYVTINRPKISKTIKQKLNMKTYENYIAGLVDKYSLQNNIVFVGNLNEEELIKRYLKANVFVCASSIENHSQTVSEAKILGVPTVAAFVGGIVERIKHGEDGFLYQHNAPYMIAEYVSRIFDSEELAKSISEKAHENASALVGKENNMNRMIEIYKSLMN